MRSFIYLDQYKLYSFSSQLFRGLVDHVVSVSERKRQREDQPAAPAPTSAARAQVVAEIASESSAVAEKKFLHDHAFDLFESELTSRGALLDIDGTATLSAFEQSRFVRVRGPAVFADPPRIRDTVTGFNKIVEAMTYVTKFSEIEKARAAIVAQLDTANDRNVKTRLKEQLTSLSAESLARAAAGRQDQGFLDHLAYLLEYGYGDQLQIQIPLATNDGQILFSAALNRSALRESEGLLLQRYSRMTDRSLVVLGVPTQSGGQVADSFAGGAGTLRAAMANMYEHLSQVEGSFAGRMEREVVIDPVAIYVQWEL